MIINPGKKKKIVLIESRSPGTNIFSKVLLPRLGIVLLGTILKENGYDVVIMIENFHELDWSVIAEADLVGVSIITCTAPGGYEIADMCRAMGKPVVIGGSHATFIPEEAINHADFACVYESEKSFLELTNALLRDESYPYKVKGIVFKDGNREIVKTGMPLVNFNLDSWPVPDFSLICKNPKLSISPIITSLGCPFNCKFCSVIAMFGQKMRFRGEESVIEELKRQKSKWTFFYDDNFVAKKSRTKSLLETMIRKDLRKNWTAQVRAEVTKDKELMDLMKKSGCKYAYVGFESISPEILKAYNKGLELGSIKESVAIFKKYDINVHGMFVLNPELDDLNTMRKTCDFAKEAGLATVQFLNLTPLPGTKLWKPETFLCKDWSLHDAHHVVTPTEKIAPLEMQMGTINEMKRFYTLPRILKSLFTHGKLVAGFRYFGYKETRNWEKDENNAKHLEFLKETSKTLELSKVLKKFF